MTRALPAAPRRILLVRLSSLGDVVCAMPLAMALRGRYPRADIFWAVEPDAAALVRGHASGPTVVEVPRTGGLSSRGRAVAALRRVQPDLVVDCQGNTKSGTVARIAARGAPILGFDRSEVREWSNLAFTTVKAPPTGEAHTVRRNLGLLRALGVEPSAGVPDYGLAATEDERAEAAEVLRRAGVPAGRPLVLVHPGRLTDIRTWTVAGIVGLAEECLRRGRAVAIEGDEPKRPREAREAFRRLSGAGVADLTTGLPLRRLLGLMGHLAEERRVHGITHCLVSPDTLHPHLAAAVGLPVVLLAGPQDPARTGPLGASTRVVHAWEGLPCAPCRERRCHFQEDRACMRRIPVTRVMEALEDLAAEPE